jgi:hypothetical protein
VEGLTQIDYATCSRDGGNATVSPANYTCNQGYYKVDAPLFCKGTVSASTPKAGPTVDGNIFQCSGAAIDMMW